MRPYGRLVLSSKVAVFYNNLNYVEIDVHFVPWARNKFMSYHRRKDYCAHTVLISSGAKDKFSYCLSKDTSFGKLCGLVCNSRKLSLFINIFLERSIRHNTNFIQCF